LCESLVRILTGLNRDLEGLLRATSAMRPYFGENPKDGKFPHLLIQLNKALDVPLFLKPLHVRSAEEADCQAPQHFLYFLPLPQGQRSFRPALGRAFSGSASLERPMFRSRPA
jgi:hypothetical protein